MKTGMLAVVVAGGLAAGAAADVAVYGADVSKTSSLLHAGDRELVSIGFAGVSTVMGGSDFTRWADGRLTNNVGTYGWNDLLSRDMNSGGNAYSANPDRADNASLMPAEGQGKGSLRDVFGSFQGYKNLSWIIDGEDAGSYTLDLFYAEGQRLNSDGDGATAEISVLERGGNSDFMVYGIRADHSLTAGVLVQRSQMRSTGWTLDTLEIAGAQQVTAVGISLADSWDGLIGVRIGVIGSYNGPDIVAVGSLATVPAPAGLAVLGLGAAAGLRRRR
jgi:MYXO-CTERM domain-containing protein